ncbi:MAG: IclR family transcriptional regulator [Candidatus Marinimicrobia bacterium]|nr:IclR family transcriptional regulator [Candidatus Neomarinimicrobiota bacterium]
MSTANLNPAVEKTLLLLRHLGQSEGGLMQAELARALGIAPSTCYRILQTLRKHDWVCKGADGRYDLSGGVFCATLKLHRRLVRWEHCRPLLDELATATGLTAKLSLRQGDRQVTILRAESPQPLSVSGKVGAWFPLIEGSVGAALLSRTPEEEIRELVRSCPEEIPERANPGLVLARIQAIGVQGFCLNTNQARRRLGALSAPLIGADGEVVAALTLLGVDEDFAGKQAGVLARRLLRAARRYEKEHP